ncbi:MAG: hypothetical protein IKL63_06610 [Alistipes sp.]|nr:hypothetical protein [Alistipes sp.]
MKRFTAIMVAIAAMFMASCATYNDVVVTYEQLPLDASFKQFKKATKTNQIEILNYLVTRANEEYLKCKTIDDLYNVKEGLNMIKFYNNEAKQKSIAVTNAIRKLDSEILQTEAIYKNESYVDASRTNYQNKGQED